MLKITRPQEACIETENYRFYPRRGWREWGVYDKKTGDEARHRDALTELLYSLMEDK